MSTWLLCIKCNNTCNLCLSKEECKSCIDGYSLHGKECLDSCPYGTTSINNVCESCKNNCETCEKETTICTSCDEGYNLLNNVKHKVY